MWERNVDWLPLGRVWNSQPRHVPWPGIKLVFAFAGGRPATRATLVRALLVFCRQIFGVLVSHSGLFSLCSPFPFCLHFFVWRFILPGCLFGLHFHYYRSKFSWQPCQSLPGLLFTAPLGGADFPLGHSGCMGGCSKGFCRPGLTGRCCFSRCPSCVDQQWWQWENGIECSFLSFQRSEIT